MEIFKNTSHNNDSLSLAIGTFDGIHPGHKSIIRAAIQSANEHSIPSAVLTFEPDPVTVLSDKSSEDRRLLTRMDKISILNDLGVDKVFELEFNQQFATTSASDFIHSLLIDNLNVQEVCVGYDFRFGKGREGNTEFLRKHLENNDVRVQILEPVSVNDKPLSSSRIREYIKSGQVKQARSLMGRPYVVCESLQKGEGRGKSIGFPTMNFPIQNTIHPRKGVYLVWFGREQRIPSIANFGYHPTVGSSDEALLEVHTLHSPPESNPGQTYHIYFEEFLREEKDFESIDHLKKQIQKDTDVARNRFQELSKPHEITQSKTEFFEKTVC